MILLVDTSDSFTWNLVHLLGDLGAECRVVRNDAMTAAEALALAPSAIVLSPGPSTPDEAGLCLDLVRDAGDIPLLGVCLGHQAIGQAFGGTVIRGGAPMHGKVSPVMHDGAGLFEGLPTPFAAARYHSLVIDPARAPNALQQTAWTADGVIMGVQHRTRPVHGVQFHPESIASEHGHALLANFLRLANLR